MTSYLASFVPAAPALRHLSHTKTLPYSPTHIFNVLSDIGAYEDFSTLIATSKVTSKDASQLPKTAKLSVGYPPIGLVEEWPCTIVCNRQAGTVLAKSLNEGTTTCEIFKMKWTVGLTQSKEGTTVKLELDLKFRSTVVDQVFAQLEAGVAWKMMAKFEARIAVVEEREKKKKLLEEKKANEASKKKAAATTTTTTTTTTAPSTTKSKVPPKKLEVRSGSGKVATVTSPDDVD